MHNYYNNTSSLALPVYGNHIYNLVNYIRTIKDANKRTQYAHTIVSIIKKIHTSKRHQSINLAKIWHDLHIMSDYQLDINAPYPQPKKSTALPPQPIDYIAHQSSKYRQYYGANLTNYIAQLAEIQDKKTQEQLLIRVVKLMYNLHKKRHNLAIILEHVQTIGGKKLAIHFDAIKEKIKN